MLHNRMRAAWMAALLLSAATSCDPEDDGSTPWTTAFDATEVGWLLSTWGPTPDDVYTVGGSPTSGVITHFDGSGWSPVEIGLDVPLLNWVWGFGPDDVTIVGNQGTVIHWDGSTWELQDTPTDQTLWGVWGAAPDDLWAVGGEGRMEGQATILRYDGSAWTSVALPPLMRMRVYALFKVWGTSSDHVFMVGQRGALLHWDGSTLEEVLIGTTDDLISLWGTGPDRIAVAGGRGNGVVATWDGVEWRTAILAPLPGLNGVWMRTPNVVHVVGVEGTIATVDFDTLEYEEQHQDTRLSFHNVFGDAAGNLTAVGGSLSFPMGPYQGIAYRRHLGAAE